MTRYYGSPGDVRLEFDEFERTGRLQPSFAELLRVELTKLPRLLPSRLTSPRRVGSRAQ